MNYKHAIISLLLLSIISTISAQKLDWMEDQPPTDRITRTQTNKLSVIDSYPRRSSGSLKESPSAQQLAFFDMICWKPFSTSTVKAAQAINPNMAWLRIYCPQEWQGATEAPDKQGSGYPFNTSGPATANNQIFAGHFAYKPFTTLTGVLTADGTSVAVAEIAKIKTPQYCVIYPADSWDNAEHVLVTEKNGSSITITKRGYKSVAKEWPSGSKIAVHQLGNGTTNDNWCYNLSSRCPKDANGKRACDAFGEWLPLNYDNNANGTPADAVCDGILYDSDAFAFTEGGSVDSRNADFDNNGVSDWGFETDGTNFWGDGLETFYQTVREGLDKRGCTNAVVLGGVAESWGVLPNNGTQMEAGWDGQFSVGGKAAGTYDKINFYFSSMKAQTGHGVIGPRVTDVQSKCASALYTDNGETRNAPVRFSYVMSMLFDGTWFSSMNGYGDAFHYFDEDAVYLQGENYGKSVPITNTTDIRANNKWLGKALGQYQRIYDSATFAKEKNLMPNGDFESSSIAWTGTLMSSASHVTDKHYEGSGALLITPTIPNPGSRVSDAKLKGPAVALTAGKEYTLCFAILSESPARHLTVQLGSLNQSLYITPGWNKHVMSWKESTGGNIQPTLSVGAELTKIWLDQVYVFEGASDIFRRDFENGIIIANAMPDAKTIQLNGTFQRIDGNLDKVVNNGAKNLTEVTVPKNDGVFLVRQMTSSIPENLYSKISISSNPFMYDFTVNMPDGVSALDIFDLTGKNIYHKDVRNQKSEFVDLSSKQSGAYILKLIGNKINYQEKIIKK